MSECRELEFGLNQDPTAKHLADVINDVRDEVVCTADGEAMGGRLGVTHNMPDGYAMTAPVTEEAA